MNYDCLIHIQLCLTSVCNLIISAVPPAALHIIDFQAIEVSESTLYPVLRRLQKDGCLEVYDMECGGRNRRYYKITDRGEAQLNMYQTEWETYSSKITMLFSEGELA